MASDDVRALAERIVAGLQQYGDKGLRLQMEALARAVLAQETRPTCATCKWLQHHTAEDPPMCAYNWNDVGIIGDMKWFCADHEPAPPDQPREDEA